MKLDNVFIGGEKLFANISRFQREQPKRVEGGVVDGKEKRQVKTMVKQVWKPRGVDSTVKVDNRNSEVVHKTGFRYDAKVEDVVRLKKIMVGVVIHPGISYLIQEEFARQGVFSILAIPLGANMVLLEGGGDEEDFYGYVEEVRSWLDQWFKEIKPWSESIIDEERVVWVRCYAVPSHVWDSDFFSFLTKDIGLFVNSDENTTKRKTLDVARLMLRTSKKEVIHLVCNVVINAYEYIK